MEESNWLQTEVTNLESKKPNVENFAESLKLIENKITEIEIDFSKPFEKRPNKLDPDTVQALIPVMEKGVKKTFWLNIANPTYADIVRAGRNGKNQFKILRVGTGKSTRYNLVE